MSDTDRTRQRTNIAEDSDISAANNPVGSTVDSDRRGWVISVDGLDGAGKSSVLKAIEKHFAACGNEVIRLQDPGATEVGRRLRELLLHSDLKMHRRTEAMLFMASRSEMVAAKVQPAVREGRVVLLDRYLLSTVVYQSVGGSVSCEDLWRVGRWSAGDVDPDLTLLLDIPVRVSRDRTGQTRDRMESRPDDYYERVRQAFLRELPHAGGQSAVIDAAGDLETVIAACLRRVERMVADTPAT